jgi:protease-4
VAVAADSIVARPGTITGSIGVYGGKLNILGLYQKLGLNVETLSRGAHAQMLSPFKDFDEDEARRFQESMETVYRTFVARVSEGRGLAVEDVEAVAQGRVWSGTAAADRALVDGLGGIPRAVEMAKRLARIPADEEVALEIYPKVDRTFLQRLLSGLVSEEDEVLAALRLSPVVSAWLTAARFPSGVALTLLPYHIEIR